jgi:hypothetical protein
MEVFQRLLSLTIAMANFPNTDSTPPSPPSQEGTDHFRDMIGPKNLLTLVHNTADFLFQDLRESPPLPSPGPGALANRAAPSLGFIDILRGAETFPWTGHSETAVFVDYFALCLSAHHATVATFVPTDVDSKIRGTLWLTAPSNAARREMFEVVRHSLGWDTGCLSTRCNEHSGVGPVSGHNGEQLGVLAGSLGTFCADGDMEYAAMAADAIEAELERESQEFLFVARQRGMEIQALQLAASLTHNTGDLNQGIGYWREVPAEAPYRERFEDFTKKRLGAYGGAFEVAAALYRAILSPEGHRHYPLRGVPALRKSRQLLLPLGPFLDDWGSMLGSTKLLNEVERAEVLAALLSGCKKIAGQQGYYRALAGMIDSLGGSLERVARHMPNSIRGLLKDSEIRKKIDMRRISFESQMKKRAQEILSSYRGRCL